MNIFEDDLAGLHQEYRKGVRALLESKVIDVASLQSQASDKKAELIRYNLF